MSQEEPKPKDTENEELETGIVLADQSDLTTLPKGKNPWPTKAFMRAALLPFVGKMEIKGQENFVKLDQNRPTLIAFGPHLSNVDVPALYTTFSRHVSGLVIPHSSTHDRDPGHRIMYALAGGEIQEQNDKGVFIAVPYVFDKRLKETGKPKYNFGHGKWDTRPLDNISRLMRTGRTPLIAAAPFAPDEPMNRVGSGVSYLALSTGAQVIPVGIDVRGPGTSVEGGAETWKAFGRNLSVGINVGEPVNIELTDLTTLGKPQRGNKRALEEHRAAVRSVGNVRDQIGEAIAQLLPSDKQCYYGEEAKAKRASKLRTFGS